MPVSGRGCLHDNVGARGRTPTTAFINNLGHPLNEDNPAFLVFSSGYQAPLGNQRVHPPKAGVFAFLVFRCYADTIT